MIGSYSNVLPLFRRDHRRTSDRDQPFDELAARAAGSSAEGARLISLVHPKARDGDQPAILQTLASGGPPGQLAVEISASAKAVTIALSGELDFAVTPILKRHLALALASRPQQLVFDMAGVAFLDCAAARLITSMDGFLPDGLKPVIRSPSHAVRRILELTGLDAYCTVEDQ